MNRYLSAAFRKKSISDLEPRFLSSFLPSFGATGWFQNWQHRVGEAMETQAHDSQPYSQGEFFFPSEGSGVSCEGAAELLHRVIQPNYTHWVSTACNQTEGHRISLYFSLLVGSRHSAYKRKAEFDVCGLGFPTSECPFTTSQSTYSGVADSILAGYPQL